MEQNVYPNSLFQEDLKTKAALEEIKEDANVETPSGVPEFWLTIFRSVDMLSDMLQVNQKNIPYSRYSFSFVELCILSNDYLICTHASLPWADNTMYHSYYECEYNLIYLYIMNTVIKYVLIIKIHDNVKKNVKRNHFMFSVSTGT